MRALIAGACALVAAVLLMEPIAARIACADLASLTLPNATITRVEDVRDAFSPDGQGARVNVQRAFCRVVATLRPSSDSSIAIEVWMPAAGWNGKFQAVGNGGFTGFIAYPAMLAALERGYATSSTDTGHAGEGASFALGHPEKVHDFGWRAVHEMTVAAKSVIAAHYDSEPRFSYWNGCSAGGRQGMKEAQRFPADFDGIIAGAPGVDWTGRAAQAMRVAQAWRGPNATRLSESKAQLVHQAVLAACDARDGVVDRVVGDPRRCSVDPAVLQCTGAETSSCLTTPQVNAARLLYAPLVDRTSSRETAGLAPGSELGWTDLGWSDSAQATGLEQFRFLVFADPRWTIDRFNPDADLRRADYADAGTINALDPNLAPFIARGGKLIQYHGWSDPQISPGNSVGYYERVVQTLGGVDKVHDAYRLFMAPGMSHCGGGEGPNTFDMVAALERWVERGEAPDQIVAARWRNGMVDRTRPICPYPQVAVYSGSGSTDDAANFSCRLP